MHVSSKPRHAATVVVVVAVTVAATDAATATAAAAAIAIAAAAAAAAVVRTQLHHIFPSLHLSQTEMTTEIRSGASEKNAHLV